MQNKSSREKKLTAFQAHQAKWKNCDRCKLCEQRTNVVFARGKIPAPILLIGESPGTSEDILATPFIGPAGKLLDRILERSIDGQFDYCITNLVGCIPKESEGDKSGEPPLESIKACEEKLVELVNLCKPKLIVLVGKLSHKFVSGQAQFGACSWLKGKPMQFADIIHPAAILRADVSQKGLAIQRSIVTLEEAIESLL